MSFIKEDDKLATLLAGLGAASLMKFSQDLGDWQTRWQLGSYLAQSLKSQLNSPVSTESGITSSAQAKISDLDSLDKFAKWLADHKITWNGQRIAWRMSEQRPDEALEVPVTNTANPEIKHQPEVFVSKPELLDYLKYLRDNMASTNKTLQLKLNSIIGDVNTHLLGKGEQLSTKPEPAAQKPADNTVTTVAPGANVPGSGPAAGAGAGGAVPAGGTGGAGVPTINQIQKVIDALPLTMEDINFDRIEDFFAAYGALSPAVTNYINNAGTLMTSVTGKMTVNNQKVFSLYAGPSEVVTWLRPPQGNLYMPFIAQLEYILKNVQLVLQDLKYRYGTKIQDKTAVARINAQIDGPNSIWQHNWSVVAGWKARGASIVKPGT
jgi:hypothetical protein